ncbi:MAG: ABC transporter permease [Ignavibacteriales bacterium]|nr:ABC transporter permease [Ignavibacteriales bacterium]MCF8438680.1 ABC transporter permease [Ignavibacteriales bacterium]
MRKNFLETARIIFKELTHIKSDRDIFLIILIAPLFYALFYGSIYIYKSENEIPIVIVDEDKTFESRKFIRYMGASPFLEVCKMPDQSVIKKMLITEEKQAAIIVPEGYGKALKTGKQSTVKLLLNTQRFLHSNDVNKTVHSIIIKTNSDFNAENFKKKGFAKIQAESITNPIKENIQFLFNPAESYGDFLFPAILILLLHQTLLIGIAETTINEINRGEKGLFSRKEISPTQILIRKYSVYLTIYLIYFLLFASTGFELYGMKFKGNYFTAILLLIPGYLAVIAAGTLIGTIVKNKMKVLQVVAFSTYPLFFLSGYSWPSSSMPVLISTLAELLPFTHMLKGIARIGLMGADILQTRYELTMLLIITISLITVLYFRLKNIQNNNIHNKIDPED